MLEHRPYGSEPPLREALDDPIIQQVMLRDGVTRGDLMRLSAVARRSREDLEWRGQSPAN